MFSWPLTRLQKGNMDALNTELVYQFFACFSRFECALKRSGFLKVSKTNGAEPHWNKYAKSLHGRFKNVAGQDFKDAVAFLLDEPPQRQVVDVVNGEKTLTWAKTSVKRKDEKNVLSLVSVVRNNLFHGGKYSTGLLEEPARNEDLLKATITILHHCLPLNKKVHLAFKAVA